MADPEIVQLVRDIVQTEVFGNSQHGTLKIFGGWSKKKLGEAVADALMANPLVLIDARELRTIAGRKPIWK